MSWTQTSAPTVNWRNVASSSDGTKLVAVAGGGIYTNSDSGNGSWILQTSAPTASWRSVASSSDGTKLVAVVNIGGIYTSTDSGVIWTLQSDAPFNNWTSVASSSDGTKLVALATGGGGGIYTSTYSGVIWTLQRGAPTNNANWQSVASSSDGTKLVAVVSGGGIYTNLNSGNGSWILQTSAPTASWRSVASSSNGTKLVAVVFGGGIYTSSPPIPYPCFKEDSKILTNMGYVPIQDLQKGDLVKTLNHGFVPINMIGSREITNTICEERIKDKLYVCHQSEYPEVFEDLVITGCHSILVDEFKEGEREKTSNVLSRIFVTDKKYRLPACVDERTKPYEEAGEFKIYHVALDNDDSRMNYGIYANGLLVESTSQRYLKELSGMTLIHPFHL